MCHEADDKLLLGIRESVFYNRRSKTLRQKKHREGKTEKTD